MPRARSLLALFFLLVFAHAAASAQTLEAQFDKLHKLRVKVMQEHATAADEAEFRNIRDFYLGRAAEAGPFLAGKLRLINGNEAKFLKAPDDCDGGLTYFLESLNKKTIGLAKMDVVNILAELYPKGTPEIQADIVKAIGESYTPSSCGKLDVDKLNHALVRIGPNGIMALLDLAVEHVNELARCGAAEGLKELAGEIKQANPTLTKMPPAIRCEGNDKVGRLAAATGWREWWSQHQATIKYPTPPSPFDEQKAD